MPNKQLAVRPTVAASCFPATGRGSLRVCLRATCVCKRPRVLKGKMASYRPNTFGYRATLDGLHAVSLCLGHLKKKHYYIYLSFKRALHLFKCSDTANVINLNPREYRSSKLRD